MCRSKQGHLKHKNRFWESENIYCIYYANGLLKWKDNVNRLSQEWSRDRKFFILTLQILRWRKSNMLSGQQAAGQASMDRIELD